MSCEVVSVPQISVALSQAGSAAAAAGSFIAPAAVGLGVAYGAYKVVQKLRSDYNAALSDLAERKAESDMAQQLWTLEHGNKAMVAQTMAEQVAATGPGGAQEFVTSSIYEVQRLAQGQELESYKLRALELAERLKMHCKPEELTGETIKLTADLHAAINKLAASDKMRPDVQAMFSAARAELALLKTDTEREPLLAQLARLEALPAEERRVVLQGIANVRDRTGKLLQTQVSIEQTKIRRREIAAQAVAMLQAISKVPEAPEAAQALKILEQLSKAFAAKASPSVSALEGFLDKARALFEACEARLRKVAEAAYVTDTVAEVLMEMGYSVSEVPEEGKEACMVSLDQSTGMVVTMDQAGQLKTEMVAFDEQSREPDMESQERVCSLVDEIFEGLKKRDIQVKEKFRKTMKHGKLKLLRKPEQAAPQEIGKPKERALT